MTEPGQRRVGAVIAAFNPDPELVTNAAAIAAQVDQLVVVDDGSTASSAVAVLAGLELEGVKVVKLNANSGIAAALNRGLESFDAPVDFVLTFDQDSLPVPDYVTRALESYDIASAAGRKVGFVCAESFSDHKVPVLGGEGDFSEAFDPMQSGFFIPIPTLTDLGAFETGFFIDCVDSEFTARTRAAGYSIIIGKGCEVEHRLGARLPAKLFGRQLRFRGTPLSFNYYSPFRMYYIMRNGTTLARRYWRSEPGWVLRRLIEDAKAQLLRFSFSPDRRNLVLAAWQGLCDSLRGRQGRISDDLVKRFAAR